MVTHMVGDRGREADPAGARQRLEPCGDVDAVADHGALLGHDVAEIDADAPAHPLALGADRFDVVERQLHVDGTAHRFDGADELGIDAVAGGTEELAAVLRHQLVDQGAMSREPRHRALVVAGHHPRVADDVARQHGRQTTLHHGLSAPLRSAEGASGQEQELPATRTGSFAAIPAPPASCEAISRARRPPRPATSRRSR